METGHSILLIAEIGIQLTLSDVTVATGSLATVMVTGKTIPGVICGGIGVY